MSKLLIGWAEESIVPEKKVSLAGQFFERISEYVESEITVTAMAVEADGDEMIMVSADIVKCEDWLLELARSKFEALGTGVDPMKMMVAVTHTHTSHVLRGKNRETFNTLSTKGILEEFLPAGKKYTSLVTADDTGRSGRICSGENCIGCKESLGEP